MRTLILLLVLTGCSSVVNPDTDALGPDVDGGVMLEDGAVELDAGDPQRDSGSGACQLDVFEPDDRAATATFDATWSESVPRFVRSWEGTWATDGSALDVDRVRLAVPRELAVVAPRQTWIASVTDAREIQVDIYCDADGSEFAGCEGGTLVDSRHCRVVSREPTVVIEGLCSTGAATMEIAAWQADDAPCERTISVELTH